MAPFFSTLEKSSWVNVTLVSGFWGKLGHSNAVPYTEVAKAVRAVCKSDIVSSDDFLQSDFFAMPSAQGADKADRKQIVSQIDLTKSALIRDYLLKTS
jgi:hypothetical protein